MRRAVVLLVFLLSAGTMYAAPLEIDVDKTYQDQQCQDGLELQQGKIQLEDLKNRAYPPLPQHAVCATKPVPCGEKMGSVVARCIGIKCVAVESCGKPLEGLPQEAPKPQTSAGGTGTSGGAGGGVGTSGSSPSTEVVRGADMQQQSPTLTSGIGDAFNENGGGTGGGEAPRGDARVSDAVPSLINLFSGLLGLFSGAGGGGGGSASQGFGWQRSSSPRSEPQPVYVYHGRMTTAPPQAPTYRLPEYAPTTFVTNTFGDFWYTNPAPIEYRVTDIPTYVSPLEEQGAARRQLPFVSRSIELDSVDTDVPSAYAGEGRMNTNSAIAASELRNADVVEAPSAPQIRTETRAPEKRRAPAAPATRQPPARAVSVAVNTAVGAVFDALPWPAGDVLPILSNILPPPAISVGDAASGENVVNRVLGLYTRLLPERSQSYVSSEAIRALHEPPQQSVVARIARGFSRMWRWVRALLFIE